MLGFSFRDNRLEVSVRTLVYVSPDPGRAEKQLARRIERLEVSEPPAWPPTDTVLAILAEALRASRLGVTPEELTGRLSARGTAVTQEQVERVFEHYGLTGGKKNGSPPPNSSGP